MTMTRGGAIPNSSEIAADLGHAIQKARKAAGFRTQRALGDAAGVDQSSVSDWENGTTAPSLAMLLLLDDLFGLSPGGLLVDAGLIDPDLVQVDLRAALLALPNAEGDADLLTSIFTLLKRLGVLPPAEPSAGL